jgi:hypothetical protein
MKKISLTLFAFAIVVSTIAQQLATNTKVLSLLPAGSAVFTWTSTSFDFGKIKAGLPVTHEFSFTNTGETPLVISSVQASCGCTVTDYSKAPIDPGQKGYVKATYNAAKVGQFSKTVTVNANTDGERVQLTIKGEVVEQVVQ